MDKREKLEMLRKLSEKELTKKFLIPLFESEGMGCKSVRYTHRRLEFGKDVVYFKENEYGKRVYTGVQVKKTHISTGSIDNILRQISEALGEPFIDLVDGKKRDLDRIVLLTSGEVLEEAKDSFWASLKGNNLDRFVTCTDGNQLVHLLDKYMPSAFWDEYDYFNRYFNSMRADFTTIKDISAIGQKEPIWLETIFVSLKLTEETKEREAGVAPEKECKIFEDRLGEREKEDLEKPVERTNVIDAEEAVEDYDRVVIVGAPGSGKTTLLRYLALESCRENLEKQERASVPIPVTLRQLTDSGKDLRAYIDDVFEKYDFPNAKKFIEKDMKEGKCTLFLDGFDELATKENQESVGRQIEQFAKEYPSVSVVVTSRVAGYHDELRGFTKVELMEFDDRQTGEFIENWFGRKDPGRAKSMFNAIRENERIKTLARNPLMIAIIAIIYEDDRELPQRRADLYERCVEVLLSKWDVQKRLKNKYPAAKKQYILRKLALYGHSNNKRIMTEEEIVEEMLRHLPQIDLAEREAKSFLNEIWQRSYLLRQISMDRYDFLHLSFQEYFTALELKESPDGLSTIIQNLDKPWWEEPILLYAGISRDASALIRTIDEKVPEDIFCSNLMMFGKCIADADFTEVCLKNKIANQLWSFYEEGEFRLLRDRAMEILSLIKPDDIIESLIKDLGQDKIEERYVRGSAADALGSIGSEKAIEPLLKTLATDKDSDVRGRAAYALGRIGSEKAIEPLLKTLATDKDSSVRGRAAYALGRIGSEKAIEPLLKTLATDKDSSVRGRAADALGSIGSEKAIEPLLKTLATDKGSSVRGPAAYALGRIGSEKAIEPLLKTLATDKDSYVRGPAADALGSIGSEKAIEALKKGLEDEGSYYGRRVKDAAFAALEKIRDRTMSKETSREVWARG